MLARNTWTGIVKLFKLLQRIELLHICSVVNGTILLVRANKEQTDFVNVEQKPSLAAKLHPLNHPIFDFRFLLHFTEKFVSHFRCAGQSGVRY